MTFTPPNQAKRSAGTTADPSAKYDPTAFSSSGGPLHVSYLNYFQPFSPYMRKAFQALGFQELAGLNSGKLHGWGEMTFTQDPQAATRSSSETSFLQQALATSTLQVYHVTTAKKILFDANKKATGVVVSTGGYTPYTLSVRKEVIVAAGAVCVPHQTASSLLI